MTFSILLLGFGVGLLFVLPPGPLAITLVEVGVSRGRVAGARSGFGIAAGDLAVGSAAGVVVVSGGALPDSAFATIQSVSALVLIALGIAMVLRPTAVESLAAKHRLVKAQSVATSIHIDDSQLARADRLMKDIEKRLETASRVIQYEAELDTTNFDDVLIEEDILEEADACLGECEDVDVLMTTQRDWDKEVTRYAIR